MVYNEFNVVVYYLVEMIKFILILYGIFGFKLKKKKYAYIIALIPVVLIIAFINTDIRGQNEIITTVTPFVYVLTAAFLLEEKIIKGLMYSIFSYVIILFSDACIGGIISLVTGLTMKELANDNIHMVSILIGIPIFGFISLIRRIRKKSYAPVSISNNIFILLIAGISCSAFFIASLSIISIPMNNAYSKKVLLAFTIFMGIAYMVGCLMMIFVSKSRDNYRILSQINQTVIESQKNYYTLAHEKQQEIRGIKHDMKNHLSCIEVLYKKNRLEEMHGYIRNILEQTDKVEELFDTGNDIVNAIINDAASKLKNEGISIKLEGNFPKDLDISSMDLCAIFANVINNAVEAVQKIKTDIKKADSYIYVGIKSYKEDLFIDIYNPVAQKVNISGGIPRTTKKDKSNHGFGIENMTKSIKKYNGSIKFECRENFFLVHIHIRNPQ